MWRNVGVPIKQISFHHKNILQYVYLKKKRVNSQFSHPKAVFLGGNLVFSYFSRKKLSFREKQENTKRVCLRKGMFKRMYRLH